MKKETIVAILFILISIPIGIYLSMFPNTNTAYAMFQRIGHSWIFAGIFMVLREITFFIRIKLYSQTVSELFDKETDMIEFNNFIILKENNQITFKIDLFYHFSNYLSTALLGCVCAYIFVPSLNLELQIEGLPEGLGSLMIILEMLFILIAFVCIFVLFIFYFLISRFNIIKKIDVERRTITITNRKRILTLPFSNLKELDVWQNLKNEKTKSYFLIMPIANHSGDISIINSCRHDDFLLILRDDKTNEFLLELKESMVNFLSKFSF
ncbi:hypothetical protein DSAG12_02685 [Promethearchaeum syntrophicum]|uniref:Uncharacterized protein n=1 Tax=Promethearchaeum syntrophicum TaxID=2594042 RepID=A0A5B9DCY3_9ARCH|nr:hypothetical protein [Candidatus Prometheoarchaeum syntrophicum]QEE16855.1 hypothetical protein DSAG12_02685 [Candidatus Prometheoarchaeum syntrophicum]